MKPSSRPFVAAKASLIGGRDCNQDRCFFLDSGDSILLGLADGLGGHPRGEVAAQLLQDVSETLFRREDKPLAEPQRFMLRCIGKAHRAIRRFGQRQAPPIVPRTTAVMALIQDGVAHWVHVGDSRLYFIREGRVLTRTRDHAHVEFLHRSSEQGPRARASLTRCLGGLDEPPLTTCGPPTALRPGDALLLCSDGLWGQLNADALVSLFDNRGESLEHRLPHLVEKASLMPQSDNVTAVALQWRHPADPIDNPAMTTESRAADRPSPMQPTESEP
jgi:serine/threonine protein phosphatase PrpC